MFEIPALTFKLLVLSLITSNRQLIHDKTADRSLWNDSYDFIVVGAGAAGCVVANRLAASGKATVLLIEAGGAQDAIYNDIPAQFMNVTAKRPDLQWVYYLEPQKFAGRASPGGTILQIAGKTLGGSSTHNNMVFNRGNARDYDLWEQKYGAKGWGFKDVLPFFNRFENNQDPHIVGMSPGWHGTHGPVQITTPKAPHENLLRLKAVYNSLGFKDTDVNGPDQVGTMIGQSFVTTEGLRASSSNSYIDPNPYPHNLHIVTQAVVSKVLFSGVTAVGVEFVKADIAYKVFANKEVILSAGAINTPQLLMLSGVGPKEHLSKFKIPVVLDLPVGNNFKNHITFNKNLPWVPPLTNENLDKLYNKKSGILAAHPQISIFFNTKSNQDKNWPNIFIWSAIGQNEMIDHVMFLGLVNSAGTVRLQSLEPTIQPLIDPQFLTDEQDYTAAIEATKFMFYFSSHPLIAGNVSLPTLHMVGCPTCPGLPDYQCTEGIKCFVENYSTTISHPCCTTRMGDVHRKDVVVDPYLRVKNAQNLRVCDPSIMPDIPNGNLYAPSLMIGEKCAQIVKDSYHL